MRTLQLEREKRIQDYIEDFIDDHGCSPSNREIAAGTNLPLTTVQRYLKRMREQGIIDYDGVRSITTRRQNQTKEASNLVPILGNVSCGVPKYAEGNIEEYVRLPVALFGRGDFYLLRANGDSMIEAGIDDGDLVLIRQQSYADPGQIVVALMEDEATLKRFYPEPRYHRIRLHPENPDYNDIYVDECIIQGVAVKVLKDLM
ncbi:transcriptional repressor LexA [Pseudoramibacter faecis]|uniref:transcriptional repressor LexA n=1 Tax=Pseudoramibacter faecis TaxID=3108534 RepID=UPI002E76BEA2|nr:transcriptional repressor LexA [Pseudoramibacter sp. HA2172]